MKNILTHRKNLLMLFLIMAFLLAGCRKMLHEEEISIGKITSYDMLQSAVGGVYSKLALPLYYYDEFYIANIKGDDLNVGSPVYGYDTIPGIGRSCYDAEAYLRKNKIDCFAFWDKAYATIVSANNILSQYNPAITKDIRTRELLGEMYLIRAYCHFRLTRVYGQVPIIDNIDVNYNLHKPSFADIYKFIESDLRKAIELLPKNNSFARIPFITPSRGSAKAILAEVYLSWAGYPVKDASKYTLAAKEAGETIDSSNYFGLGLVSDFAFLWDKSHLYNSETVFSLYCDPPDPYPYYFDGNLIRPGTGWQGFYYRNFFPVEVNFFNNYPPGYRKEITFKTMDQYEVAVKDSLGNYIKDSLDNYILDTGTVHIIKVKPCKRIAYRKFYYELFNKTQKFPPNTGSTDSIVRTYKFGVPRVYIFRFAQTMLTYAEAMARSGQLNAQAYECVNQIRRRARQLNLNIPSVFDLPAGLSPEAFADSVVNERAWELCGEPEGRWFDLIRLEMVELLPKMRYGNEGGIPYTCNKSDYFFPVPPADTLLNPNLGNH
jgi:starch-binding outer membrane protein, SusD/RagB family